MIRALVGMETSGTLREALRRRGVDAWSCDLLDSQDGSPFHIVGNVFDTVSQPWDIAMFHTTCTFATCSAEWAYNDPDFDKYPGVGYHQKVKPGTLTGQARRDAREATILEVKSLDRMSRHIPVRGFENPVGVLSRRWRKPTMTTQPYEHGDDASKRICLWFLGPNGELEPMPIYKCRRVPGRMVEWPRGSGKMVERWSNQTDSGQNRITPSEDRWQVRSDTFPGLAESLADHLIRLYEAGSVERSQLDMFPEAA